MYVVTEYYASPKSYIIYAIKGIAVKRHGKWFDYGARSFYIQGYLPKGDYEEFDMIGYDVVRNGTPLMVVDIYAPRVFPNGTVVVRHYTITNDTGCVGFWIIKQGNTIWFRYTHKVTGCTLDQFLVEELKFDVTPLRIPYVCPNCTGPVGFRLYEVRNPKAMYDWVFSAPAPTVLTPLLSYRGDEVASVKYYKLEGGQLVEVGWRGDHQYAVITFAKASKEYYALRTAAQIVDLLIP